MTLFSPGDLAVAVKHNYPMLNDAGLIDVTRVSYFFGGLAITLGLACLTPFFRYSRWPTVVFLVGGVFHILWVMINGSKTGCGCGLTLHGLSASTSNSLSLMKNMLMIGACILASDEVKGTSSQQNLILKDGGLHA